MAIKNWTEFKSFHYANKAKDGQRLGQRFINMYIKNEHTDPSLSKLWEASDPIAADIIVVWLCDHQYYGTMPRMREPYSFQDNS